MTHTPFSVGQTMEFKLTEDGPSDPFDWIEIVDAQGNEALIIPADEIDYADELAAFVVLALNERDELIAQRAALLDACEILVKWYMDGGPMKKGEYYTTPNTDGFGKAREAIAKVKGEQ